MRRPTSTLRSTRRGAAAVELMLTMAFLLMGILASLNFTRQYHTHAKLLDEARTNSYTKATRSNENLFGWIVSQHLPFSPPSKPSLGDLKKLGKTDGGTVTPDAGDPSGDTQKPPEFDVGGDAKEGSAEYGVFGFLVGEVDKDVGTAHRSLGGIYLLDPQTVSKAGKQTMSASYVVCRECYREQPDPKAQAGWLTIDTLGWLKNSVSGLVKGLVSWMTDIDAEDVLDLISPIPLGGWDFEK